MSQPASTPHYHYATEERPGSAPSEKAQSIREDHSHGFQRPPRQPNQLGKYIIQDSVRTTRV